MTSYLALVPLWTSKWVSSCSLKKKKLFNSAFPCKYCQYVHVYGQHISLIQQPLIDFSCLAALIYWVVNEICVFLKVIILPKYAEIAVTFKLMQWTIFF